MQFLDVGVGDLREAAEAARLEAGDVPAAAPQRGWLKLTVTAVDAAGETITLSYKVAVI